MMSVVERTFKSLYDQIARGYILINKTSIVAAVAVADVAAVVRGLERAI